MRQNLSEPAFQKNIDDEYFGSSNVHVYHDFVDMMYNLVHSIFSDISIQRTATPEKKDILVYRVNI